MYVIDVQENKSVCVNLDSSRTLGLVSVEVGSLIADLKWHVTVLIVLVFVHSCSFLKSYITW